MCRWVIMAWSRSLSFDSCKTNKGGYRHEKHFISLHNASIDILRYWHRITIAITPQAERRLWKLSASTPGALSHTYTSLQTHSSLFDIVNCLLTGAATACGDAASCVCVCARVQVYTHVASRNNGSTLRQIAPLTYSHTAETCKYETFKHSAWAAVCELLEGRVVGLWGTKWLVRERETDVLMWCDTNCLSVTLCSLVVASGAQLNAVYHHHQTQCSPSCWTAHTHITQWCEQGILKCFRNYVKMCVCVCEEATIVFSLFLRTVWEQDFTSCPVLVFCFCRSIQMFQEYACMNHFENKRGRAVLRFLAHLSLFSLLSLPPPPLSLALSFWWPEQLYNWSSNGSFSADCSF